MWCLVLVFLLPSVFHICFCQDQIKIVLKKNNEGKFYCPTNEVIAPKIPVFQKFRVIVESELDISNKTIKCNANGTDLTYYYSNLTKHKDNYYYVGKEIYTAEKWKKNWLCKFDIIDVTCIFDFRVLSVEPYIQANGINITTVSSNDENFDSQGSYEYSEGEPVNFTCHNSNSNLNLVFQLSSNAYGGIQTKKVLTTVFWYLKLTDAYDGAFIQCRANDFDNAESFLSRIDLKLKKSEADSTAMIEAPIRCGEPTKSTITQENKTFCINGPVVKGLSESNILGLFHSEKSTFSILYEYRENETLHLACDPSDDFPTSDNSTVQKLNITEITASKKFGSFKLKLNVTRANINCTTSDSVTQLVLIPKKTSGKAIISTKQMTNIKNNKDSALTTPGAMNNEIPEEDDHTVVIIMITICTVLFISVLLFVIVRLFKRKPVVSPFVPDSNVNYETLPEHNKGPTPAPAQWQEVQYSAPADRIANNDYAVPFQPTVEELYSKPLPKNQRLKNNPAHASADNLNPTYTQPIPKHLRKDKLPYASVDNLTNASVNTQPYAQVAPKNQRKGVEVLPKGPEAAYAKLALKPAISKKPIMIESAYVEVMPHGSEYADSEHSYAEIKQENPYAEVGYADPNNFKAKGYVNVFKDSRYVNAEGKADYAEPAYCTINKD